MAVGSCQIPWEIDSAISLIASKRPRIMCEIGTFDGGSSLLCITDSTCFRSLYLR
jgi:hypothetical protein